MAISIVEWTMTRLLSSLVLILSAIAATSAQTVSPSNASIPTSASSTNILLRLDSNSNGGNNFTIIPLTDEAGIGQSAATLQTLSIRGNLRSIDPTNAANVGRSEVAYINCDPNDSNIDADRVVTLAGSKRPKAIVLYSTTSSTCSISGSFGFNSLYSMTSATDSQYIANTILSDNGATAPAIISTNTSTDSFGDGSQPSGTNNDGGPAPTTAVAMSILYSITGIITLLFLVIITTGALRAHRHPERYGPRRALGGRPRQSRAKGLARAMLETLPIVKFGDPEPAKPGSRDIELEDGTNSVHDTPDATNANMMNVAKDGKKTEDSAAADSSGAAVTESQSGMGPAQAGSLKSSPEDISRDGELGCSICTEDFTAGEDVRVLPCQHKFHPACIDPWLLNVSGTCPLCRHDLNPTEPKDGEDPPASNANGDELPPPLAINDESLGENSNAGRSRVSRLVDLTRLRHAPPAERIAALRALREHSRAHTEPTEATEEASRRTRLTDRLRDRFHIGNRTHVSRDESPQNETHQ